VSFFAFVQRTWPNQDLHPFVKELMGKYFFYYTKADSVRWLGHLDVLRAFERALRRTSLHVSFTQGFNPRIRINFASPLGTGITGDAEPAVIELDDSAAPDAVEASLNEVLPPGIRIHGVEEIPDAGRRDLLNSFDRAEYRIVCGGEATVTPDACEAAVRALLDAEEIPVVREREGRTRTVNVRPFLHELAFLETEESSGKTIWHAVVGIGESGNIRPAEIADALAVYLPGVKLKRAHRTRLRKSADEISAQ
jgi:radical SAM-linked protein